MDSSPNRAFRISDLPTEVLLNHIFPNLPACSLVAVSLTCACFRKICHSILKKKAWKQFSILKQIFSYGYLELLRWFTASLQYPELSKLITANPPHPAFLCAKEAAKSMDFNIICIFHSRFMSIFLAKAAHRISESLTYK